MTRKFCRIWCARTRANRVDGYVAAFVPGALMHWIDANHGTDVCPGPVAVGPHDVPLSPPHLAGDRGTGTKGALDVAQRFGARPSAPSAEPLVKLWVQYGNLSRWGAYDAGRHCVYVITTNTAAIKEAFIHSKELTTSQRWKLLHRITSHTHTTAEHMDAQEIMQAFCTEHMDLTTTELFVEYIASAQARFRSAQLHTVPQLLPTYGEAADRGGDARARDDPLSARDHTADAVEAVLPSSHSRVPASQPIPMNRPVGMGARHAAAAQNDSLVVPATWQGTVDGAAMAKRDGQPPQPESSVGSVVLERASVLSRPIGSFAHATTAEAVQGVMRDSHVSRTALDDSVVCLETGEFACWDPPAVKCYPVFRTAAAESASTTDSGEAGLSSRSSSVSRRLTASSTDLLSFPQTARQPLVGDTGESVLSRFFRRLSRVRSESQVRFATALIGVSAESCDTDRRSRRARFRSR